MFNDIKDKPSILSSQKEVCILETEEALGSTTWSVMATIEEMQQQNSPPEEIIPSIYEGKNDQPFRSPAGEPLLCQDLRQTLGIFLF